MPYCVHSSLLTVHLGCVYIHALFPRIAEKGCGTCTVLHTRGAAPPVLVTPLHGQFRSLSTPSSSPVQRRPEGPVTGRLRWVSTVVVPLKGSQSVAGKCWPGSDLEEVVLVDSPLGSGSKAGVCLVGASKLEYLTSGGNDGHVHDEACSGPRHIADLGWEAAVRWRVRHDPTGCRCWRCPAL